ncbi:MAG TPA: hypothetical protein VFO86_10570 [Terriglobia bacterium]|nr:hypothetical protein [Terriglobia bacterium]
MDFLAHGLWGGATFGRKKKSSWKWAFFWGMAPDLFAFGPAILAGIITGNYFAWASYPLDGIPKSGISAYSYNAYHVTHSLIVWAGVTGVIWAWQKRFPWAYAASALHILCDIPFHALRYFPTPYLWPLHTSLHDGIPWANPLFMLANYTLIAATYAIQRYRRAR